MDQQLLEDTIHELAARDRYMLTSAEACMHVRGVFTDLPEREVIDAMWGEHAPPDLEAMLVMEIGGRSDMVLAIPLGAAEAARWHAATNDGIESIKRSNYGLCKFLLRFWLNFLKVEKTRITTWRCRYV